jgi:malonyl-CoA/methylmalonyl-CoA synthetase
MGGYKISALDIERVLLDSPLVSEIAVLGLPDDTWGEKVAAIVVLREAGTPMDRQIFYRVGP